MATEEMRTENNVDVNRNYAQLSPLADFELNVSSIESKHCFDSFDDATLSGENNPNRLHQSAHSFATTEGNASTIDGRTLSATSNDHVSTTIISGETLNRHTFPDSSVESTASANGNGNGDCRNRSSSSCKVSHNTRLNDSLHHEGRNKQNGNTVPKKNSIGANDCSNGPDNAHMEQIDHLRDLPQTTTANDRTATNVDTEYDATQEKVFMSSIRKPFWSIPGPWPSLPLIGTGWQYFYLVGRYDLNKLHEAHIDRYRTYGPIVREEYQWGKAIVHIYDPADFETVFRSQGACPIRPPNEFVSQLRLSKPHMYPNVGFANLNGPEWLNLRRKLAPAIMKLRTINESMLGQNEVCDNFLDYLWQVRDENTNIVDNLQETTYRLALESICLMCLDSRIGSFPDACQSNEESSSELRDGDILIEATKMLFDSFNKLYYGLPFWKYFATAAYSNLDKAETTLYEVTTKYIDRAIDCQDEQFDSNHSVLKTLLANKGLSKDEVKVTVMDFIIGGIFSVSNSLVYLFYHLSANPHVQEKLYQEIKSVLGSTEGDFEFDNQNQRVTSAQLSRMTYLKACVSESFRLNCPVPGIMRVTTEPLVLSGYDIPANTPVFSHCMTTCRLEEYFKDAHRFCPERWLDQEKSNHPFALLPFGFGSRMCVGKRFSENEIYLSTARLIKAYRLELAPGSEELELRHAFMVIPAKPISLRIARR